MKTQRQWVTTIENLCKEVIFIRACRSFTALLQIKTATSCDTIGKWLGLCYSKGKVVSQEQETEKTLLIYSCQT